MGPIPDHPERLNVIASSRRARLVLLATCIPTGYFNNKKPPFPEIQNQTMPAYGDFFNEFTQKREKLAKL
jgi:hypothetical protein